MQTKQAVAACFVRAANGLELTSPKMTSKRGNNRTSYLVHIPEGQWREAAARVPGRRAAAAAACRRRHGSCILQLACMHRGSMWHGPVTWLE